MNGGPELRHLMSLDDWDALPEDISRAVNPQMGSVRSPRSHRPRSRSPWTAFDYDGTC